MTGESDHIVAELTARIFADRADPQTINRLDDGAWKAPFWQALSEATSAFGGKADIVRAPVNVRY
jgi:hypothetical protein